MKKKNLIILLIFPFLISVFCIITVNTTYNKIDVDISYIDWKYNDVEGFQLTTGDYQYLLEAEGVNQRHYKATGDTALIWSVKNEDPDLTEPCAEIVEKNGKYYLNTLRTGNVIVSCTNKKGNVSRQMTVVIYKDAAILFYPKISKADTRVDPTLYYGEYDHRIGTAAVIDMTLLVVPSSAAATLNVECTPNISFDAESGRIYINSISGGNSAAKITLSHPEGLAEPQSYSFEIVDEGVNVYTYDDLLYCTNASSNTGGHIAVLRKSFESIYNAYKLDANGNVNANLTLRTNNVECFGNYNPKTGTFSFQNEIYSFTTTYNREYIDQWNTFASKNAKYSSITDQVNVGLHVQKDFYGNGYTINLNNLVFPKMDPVLNPETGETVYVPRAQSTDLFKGPLYTYCLGDPNNTPMVALYGQDNIGMLIDGDGITLNDVNLKNCEFGDRRENLSTAGTVLEVAGDNVVVKNSRLSNGKNVVRSFSSMNFTLQNCLLSYAQNFLLVTGSNEYVAVNADALSSFQLTDGSTQQAVIKDFMSPDGKGNAIVDEFLQKAFKTEAERKAMKKSLLSIQNALNQTERVKGNYHGSTTVEDCLFYQSGISAICMESLFNSPFLEMGSPSYITGLFNMTEAFGVTLVPYLPTGVSGISYPVKLNVSGDTRFYDYKTSDEVELNGLMKENISAFAGMVGPMIGFETDQTITLDTLFPLKSMLLSEANSKGLTHKVDGETYVNIPIAFYGGGLNLSQVTFNGYEHAAQMSSNVEMDVLEDYLRKSDGASYKEQIRKSVIAISGYSPFQFRFMKNGFLYGQAENMISDLIANAKENLS